MKASDALARNLRKLRQERGLSASELARSAGVSKATVSAIERGLGNPAIDTVWSLARALDLPFGALFEDDAREAVEMRRFSEAPIVSSATGFLGRRLLSLRRHGELELYVLSIAAGAKRNAEAHSLGVIEHAIVVEGEAEVGLKDQPHLLKAGECLSFPADRPHVYHGVADTTLLLLTDYPG